MYKVFLVDDEIVIREGIRNSFPWDESDFSLCGEAPDGEMALTMLQDIKPDILITDIRMPFMDGMQLCETVSRTMPWIQTVILSGYDDFSYAQKAISLGVREYLLKPVSAQELMEVLTRLSARIGEERARQADINRLKQQFASNNRLLKEKLLTDALFGNGNGAQSLLNRARSLNLNLCAKRYLAMLIALEDVRTDGAELALGALYDLAEKSGEATQLCRVSEACVVIVMGDSDDDIEERAYSFARSAIYEAERASGARAYVYIGETGAEPGDIATSFTSAQKLRERLRYLPEPERLARRISGAQDAEPEPRQQHLNLNVEPLSERLQYATQQDAESILNDYIHSMGDAALQSVMMVNFLYVEILMAASRIVTESGGEPRAVLGEEMPEQTFFTAMHTPSELIPESQRMLKKAISYRDSRHSTRYNTTISCARAYIAREYQNAGITLNDVATHVCMSNSHFCTMFSQEMGITFTEYLTALRLGKAKELLSATGMRSSDIAYAVGYNDSHYFSYLFKKNTGVTPREYRREHAISAGQDQK